jgi:hypothetical protein
VQPLDDGGDPGWKEAWPGLLIILLPPLGVRRQQQLVASGRQSPLLALRSLFVSFCFALVLVGVVVLILAAAGSIEQTFPPEYAAIGVVLLGASTLLLPRFVERPLVCTDEGALIGSYRTRMFIRIALGETPALLGFCAFVLSGAPWLYFVGAVFTVPGFVRAAPSAANLEHDQQELVTAGCGLSLVAVLRGTPTGP